MTLSAVIIPALAGYWIVYRTFYFKPTLAQTPPYAFPLLCAVIGVLLGVVAVAYTRALHVVIHSPPADWREWWLAQLNFDDLSTAGVLLLAALITPFIGNALITKKDVARKWLVPDESPLDRLLRETFEHRGFVEVVTQSADAYIGRVAGPEYPWEWPEDIVIIPLIIGYRDPRTREFVRTRAWDGQRPRTELVLPRASVLSVAEIVPRGLVPARRRHQTATENRDS